MRMHPLLKSRKNNAVSSPKRSGKSFLYLPGASVNNFFQTIHGAGGLCSVGMKTHIIQVLSGDDDYFQSSLECTISK